MFGATILVNGMGAALGGRLLDRAGPRVAFLLGGVFGGSGLALASIQHTVLGFGACYALGGGSIGALGFYHVTQAAAARAAPSHGRSQAIARLTMLGALASPIFLPLTALLVQTTTWRTTILVDAAAITLAFLLAAALVPDHRAATRPAGSGGTAFTHAWRGQAFRRLLIEAHTGALIAQQRVSAARHHQRDTRPAHPSQRRRPQPPRESLRLAVIHAGPSDEPLPSVTPTRPIGPPSPGNRRAASRRGRATSLETLPTSAAARP